MNLFYTDKECPSQETAAWNGYWNEITKKWESCYERINNNEVFSNINRYPLE
jgi:hypothetical protein